MSNYSDLTNPVFCEMHKASGHCILDQTYFTPTSPRSDFPCILQVYLGDEVGSDGYTLQPIVGISCSNLDSDY